ncbi:MAG: DUF4893 domain-containing protein [Pseudomonadota bacterium]
MIKPVAALLLVATLGGCSVYREATASTLITSVDWRQVATDADRGRLRGWHKAWDEALPAARLVNPGAIAAEPALFDPDRALPDPALPPGTYRCRTVKLGAQGSGNRAYTPYPWFECRVADEGEVSSLHKITGTQRPTGLVFRDTATRAIFLGTLVLGDETSPLRYGVDSTRDMAGYVDRIGPKRWRLVFPYPRFESLLDITEIVPAN